MLNIIIPMAGEGSRFKNAGYNIPKYEIEVKDKPIFDWSLSTFKNLFNNSHFRFISRVNTKEFINRRCEVLGIKNYSIVELESKTSGQAETVFLGTSDLQEKNPLLIFNIDTHINSENLNLEFMKSDLDGWLQLFKAPGNHWSFAKVGTHGEVLDVEEKQRISDFASTGMYYFSSKQGFYEIYNDYKNNLILNYKETYIAPMYKYMIQNKMKIGSSLIEFEKVIPLGTPQEVKMFNENFVL
jgi:dTDP-glucose pyrophosphorylase